VAEKYKYTTKEDVIKEINEVLEGGKPNPNNNRLGELMERVRKQGMPKGEK